MPETVFISYARGDGEAFATRLHDRLEENGFPAWLDRRDIKPGENWDLAIDSGIRDSWVMLFVMTPSSVNSPNCHDEWSRALSFKKPVLPLMVKNSVPPMRLHRLQYIDYTGDFDQALKQLIDYLTWMRSTAGELSALEDRLNDLRLELPTTQRPEAVQAEIDAIREQIAYKQRAVANPQEMAAQTRQEMEEAINAERELLLKARQRDLAMTRQRIVGSAPQSSNELFKDRAAEQATLVNSLVATDGDVRMVSIYGMGGAGKTALACKVMADLEKDNKNVYGLIYLSARSTGITLERVYLDSARMLGGRDEEDLNRTWADAQAETLTKIHYLLDHYTNHRYIILFDNMEDLLDPKGKVTDTELGAFIDAFLRQKHGARLLVTSREPLNVADNARRYEKIVPLDQGLPEANAIDLLRALDRDNQLGLADADSTLLETAVRKTHGYPRALEAIAGILVQDPFMSLENLLKDEDLFDQEVIVKLVQEAQSRLDGDAQRVMQALAVFGRPVRETAIRYLLEPFATGLNVEATLRQLARGRYVTVKRGSNELILHPLDKDYSYRQIPRDGQEGYTLPALEHRAASYYAQLRLPPESWKSIRDLEPQFAEFEHLVKAAHYDTAAILINDIDADYLVPWGHARRVLDMREQLRDKIMDRELDERNLGRLGVVYHTIGNIDQAISYYDQALAIAREIGDRRGESTRLGHLGIAYSMRNQLEQAISYYDQALAIAREIGDRRAEGRHLGNLGLAYRDLGQTQQAIPHYEQALAIAREIEARHSEGQQLINLGIALLDLGQLERAEDYYRQALIIAREIGDRGLEELVLGNLSETYYGFGRLDQAIESAGQALAIAREIDDRRGEGYWLCNEGKIYLSQNDLERAAKALAESLAIAREIHEPRLENLVEAHLAHIGLKRGRYAEALENILRARAIALSENAPFTAALHGLILARSGEQEQARTALRDALSAADELLNRTPQLFSVEYIRALALTGLAELSTDAVEQAEALAQAQQAYHEARMTCAICAVMREAVSLLNELQPLDAAALLPSIVAILEC